MEYYRYITGQDSSFHPSFLSFRQQTPLPSVGEQSLLMTGSVPQTPGEFQLLNSEDDEEEEIEEDLSVSEAEDHELSSASSLLDLDLSRTPHAGTQEWETRHDHGKKREERTEEHTSSDDDVEAEEHPLQPKLESRPTQRKEKKKSRGFNVRRSHRVAPAPYPPVNVTSTPQHGAIHPTSGHMGLAWMDTVNGPQLMSMQPVFGSPPQQLPPPQYVLPAQAMVSPLSLSHHPYHPPPLHQPPTYSHPSPKYTPHTHRASKPQPRSARTHRQSNKEREHHETGTDVVDGAVQADDGDRHISPRDKNESENEKVVSTHGAAGPGSGKEDDVCEKRKNSEPSAKDDKDEGEDDVDNIGDASHRVEQSENADHDTKRGDEKKERDVRATGHSVQELIEQVMSEHAAQIFYILLS